MFTRISLVSSMLALLVLLYLIGCAQPQPSIVGKWQLATQGAPGSYASLVAEQIEFKSDGTLIVYDIGKYSLSGNVLTYERKPATQTYTITIEGNTLKGFYNSEFQRVGGDPQAGLVGTWERGTPGNVMFIHIEFKPDGTVAVPIPCTYTLPDQKTVQEDCPGGKATLEFSIAGDTLTFAGANPLQYKRIK